MARLGDIAVIISVLFTGMFVVGYLSLAPWWRSSIGRSLAMSKSWLFGISFLAMLKNIFNVPETNDLYEGLRVGLWLMLPVIAVYQFWALLINGQIRRINREGRRYNSERDREQFAGEDRDAGAGGAGAQA